MKVKRNIVLTDTRSEDKSEDFLFPETSPSVFCGVKCSLVALLTLFEVVKIFSFSSNGTFFCRFDMWGNVSPISDRSDESRLRLEVGDVESLDTQTTSLRALFFVVFD